MLRTVLYLVGSILAIALLRGIIGIVTKGVAHLFEQEAKQSASSGEGFGGELVKCPSCGVYFPPAKGHTKAVQGRTLSFCSDGCRAKLA
jgi:hypothetical protein